MAKQARGIESVAEMGLWPGAGLTVLGGLASVWVVSVVEGWSTALLGVLVVGSLVALVTATHLVANPSVDTAFKLMVLTLPLTAALVIDIGGSVRLTYLFTLLALALGLRNGSFKISSGTFTTFCLHAYVVYALISTTYAFMIPELRTLTVAGFRGSVFRPLVQFGQLALMVTVFHVVLSYASSRFRVERLCSLIFWSLFLASAFGLYEFFAFTFDLPFVNLHTTPLDTAEGPQSLARRLEADTFLGGARPLAGIDVVRPRSFMVEPIEFAAYILFSLPLSVVAAQASVTRRGRRFKVLCVLVAAILFVLANSRAGFIAAAAILPLALMLAPSRRARTLVMGAVFAFLALLAFLVFPLLGAAGGLVGLVEFVRGNYEFILSMAGREGGHEEALGVFLVNPWLGVGIGNHPFYVPGGSSGTTVATSGSIYANVLSELGIVGFILFLGFVGSILLGLLRILRGKDLRLRTLAFAALISIIGVMINHIGFSGLYTGSYLWVAWAIGAAVVRLGSTGRRATRGEESSEDAERRSDGGAISQPRGAEGWR